MRHKCRDYQAEDVEAVFREWKTVRSTLGVAATGLGKTFVMCEVVERMAPQRAILLAHRSELIWQARNAFMRRGIECEIEKGDLAASTNLFTRAQVVLATVQTMGSGEPDKKRMQRFNPKDYGLLLYDESHHSCSPGNRKIVEYFTSGNPNLKVLGVTATPDRSDEKALGQIFESVAFERSILFGVDNGWLVEPEQLMVHVGGLDFSHMRTTAGDLNGADLSAAMEAESSIQGVAQPTLETAFGLGLNGLLEISQEKWGEFLCDIAEPRRTIVFTASVKQAEQLSSIFNRVVPNIASWVCGKTPDGDRQEIFRGFDSGKTAILCNCGVTTEGYDNPGVSMIVMAKPTKSRSLYAQMVGRGTRPLPGIVDLYDTPSERLKAIAESVKPKMLVMDFVGNSGKHKLMTTADILGGDFSEEAVAIANMKAKLSKTPMNMRLVIEEEEKKLKEERERSRLSEEARKAKLVARVKSYSTKINPFDAFALQPVQQKGWDDGNSLSEKQRQMLQRQGIDPDAMTYSQGKQLLNEFFRRWGAGLATVKQCALLKKHYAELDVRTLTMKQAGSMIDVLAKNGWKRPQQTQ